MMHSSLKITLIRMVKLLAVVIPALLLVLLVPTSDSAETVRIRGFFFEKENSLDVVFMGSSETFTAFSPALAYEEFGITSYPYAVSANYIDLFPYQLADIHRTQSPQMVVVDINGAMYAGGLPNEDAIFRTYIEGVPLSEDKVQTIRSVGDKDQLLSYYLPFLMYHGTKTFKDTWSIISGDAALSARGYTLLKGNISSTGSLITGDVVVTASDRSKQPVPEEIEVNLRSFLEHCRETYPDTAFLFVNMPHRVTETTYLRFQQTNTVGEIIESYGYPFLNFDALPIELNLDYNSDFYNNDHMNIYGQQKFTRYFADLLTEEYGVVAGDLSEEVKEKWDISAAYNQRYYTLFENLREEEPEKVHWLAENAWVLSELEELKAKETLAGRG